MAGHKLRAFLESRQWSDDLGRHFVDHARGDPMLPDAGSWEELEGYLRQYNAPEERIGAAKYVWQLYVKQR